MDDGNSARLREHHRSPMTGICLIISIIILIVSASIAVILPQKIQSVEIEGSSIYSDEQILSLCGTLVGKSYLSLDEDKISASVSGALPYVRRIGLSMSFPRRLVITVTEEEAKYYAAYGESGENICLLTSSLRVLQTFSASDGVPLDAYTRIILPNPVYAELGKQLSLGEDVDMSYIKSTIAAIEVSSFKGKLTLDFSNKLTIYMIYESRFKIIIGNADELSTKLSLAWKTLENYLPVLGDERTAKIDVSRLPNPIYSPDVPISAE